MDKSNEFNMTGGTTRREHISKFERFPRIFKEAARLLQKMKIERKDLKTVLYSSKLKGQCFKRVYALTHNILKNKQLIDQIIDEIQLLHKEPYINLEYAEIMVHEMAIQKKSLPGESKPILAVKKYEDDIGKAHVKYLEQVKCDMPFIPRYARVNTLVTNVSKVITWFRKKEYKQIFINTDASLSNFTDTVKRLLPGEFIQDFHFPDILVFSPNENLSETTLYGKGHIFLQDKASYIPVYVLNPPPNSKVMDCCAAPGMKTVHLAGILNNSGNIVAIDRDSERFSTLQRALEHGGVTNCEALCMDFTEINPYKEPYSSIEYILLDPSCSGSGMTRRLSIASNDEFSKCSKRLQKLSGFQIMLLKHALKFPNVKRIVYSTCSTHEEENEFVINEVLSNEKYKETFQVCNIFPEWGTRGSINYEFGSSCIRAYPDENLTNGFFVALIERKSISNLQEDSVALKLESKNEKLKEEEQQNQIDTIVLPLIEENAVKKKKKKYKDDSCCISEEVVEQSNEDNNFQNRKRELCFNEDNVITNKKHKKEKFISCDNNNESDVNSLFSNCQATNEITLNKKSRKKTKKDRSHEQLNESTNVDLEVLETPIHISHVVSEESEISHFKKKKKKKKSKKQLHMDE